MNPQAQELSRQVDEEYRPFLKGPNRLKTGVPIEDTARYQQACATAKKQALLLNRDKLAEILVEDPKRTERTIVLTHERLSRLDEMGSPLIHIHGHLHTYKYSVYKGSHVFNVACLDQDTSAFQRARPGKGLQECGYSILSIGNNMALTTERKGLPYPG
jgi:hypothetical protein